PARECCEKTCTGLAPDGHAAYLRVAKGSSCTYFLAPTRQNFVEGTILRSPLSFSTMGFLLGNIACSSGKQVHTEFGRHRSDRQESHERAASTQILTVQTAASGPISEQGGSRMQASRRKFCHTRI